MTEERRLCEWTDRLDPRSAMDAQVRPFLRAVNIPLEEIKDRVHELPAKGSEVVLPDFGDLSVSTVEWLTAHGLGSKVVPFEADPAPESYRLWKPNAFLMETATGCTTGKALDLGCGCGREAVALAAHGWKVLAVDHLPDALELGKGLAARYAPNVKDDIEWRCDDAFNFIPPLGELDLVYLLFFYDIRLLPTALQALKPGGRVLIESFSTLHRERFGKPNAQRCIDISTWESQAEGFHIESMDEQWIGERHIAQLVARKA